MKAMEVEVVQEIGEVAEETCRADFSAKAHPCCPDCQKAEFRVPSKEQCASAGCEKSCHYEKGTCDENKKVLKTPCLFPFTLSGKKYSDCTANSPYGEVERPWCVLDTEENRASVKSADASELKVGFCDCTHVKCN